MQFRGTRRRMDKSSFPGEKRSPKRFSQKHNLRPPMEVGNEFNVRIDGVNEEEEGLARVQGCLFRIPYASKGERLKVKITDIKIDKKNNIFICYAERINELEPDTPLDNETSD